MSKSVLGFGMLSVCLTNIWHFDDARNYHLPHLRTSDVHHTRHRGRNGVISRLVWLWARLSISWI